MLDDPSKTGLFGRKFQGYNSDQLIYLRGEGENVFEATTLLLQFRLLRLAWWRSAISLDTNNCGMYYLCDRVTSTSSGYPHLRIGYRFSITNNRPTVLCRRSSSFGVEAMSIATSIESSQSSTGCKTSYYAIFAHRLPPTPDCTIGESLYGLLRIT